MRTAVATAARAENRLEETDRGKKNHEQGEGRAAPMKEEPTDAADRSRSRRMRLRN